MPENNGGSMMGGFLLGAVVGAGLALIFAPMAGDETRRRIGATARKLKDGVADQMGRTKDMVKDRVGEVGAAIDAGKEAYRSTRESASMDKVQV